jgi:hypothetical protein
MTATFTQTGGIRVGEGIFDAFNAKWPFAHLTITPKQVHLSCFSYQYSFPRDSIRRLSRHRAWFSVGLRIEHTVPMYPVFLVFWTFKYAALKRQLREMGYAVDDDVV